MANYDAEPAGPRTNVPSRTYKPDGKEVSTDCYGCTIVRLGSTYAGGGALSPNGRRVTSGGGEEPY